MDANNLYQKLRKNLGNKNCELSKEHIAQIVKAYQEMSVLESDETQLLASKVFNNEDFGYYKVTIERPSRLKTEFTDENISTLLYDRALQEPMQWAFSEFGESIYKDVKPHIEELKKWCEDNDINLSSANKKKLAQQSTWEKCWNLYEQAQQLQKHFTQVYTDFNQLTIDIDQYLKAKDIKMGASERKAILSAVSQYDASAEKVIKKKVKLTGDKLAQKLHFLGCEENELANFGYFPSDKKGEYIEYETESSLRDTENIPLTEDIQAYFLKEVKPHIGEAWIHLDKTQIGYEISFNKYFYKHTPLRSIEEITQDILALEKESDGLIAEILEN